MSVNDVDRNIALLQLLGFEPNPKHEEWRHPEALISVRVSMVTTASFTKFVKCIRKAVNGLMIPDSWNGSIDDGQ